MKDLTKKLFKIGMSAIVSLSLLSGAFEAGYQISKRDPHNIDVRSVQYAATKENTDYFYIEVDKNADGKIDYIIRYNILGPVSDQNGSNGLALSYDAYRPIKP